MNKYLKAYVIYKVFLEDKPKPKPEPNSDLEFTAKKSGEPVLLTAEIEASKITPDQEEDFTDCALFLIAIFITCILFIS